ncbi:MAG: hypothetical protein CSA81_04700 [Acidobacteria bacterium]|nr:MAG: hypothetical protein CSA81_04700 [Acidobacteriota bacterium]
MAVIIIMDYFWARPESPSTGYGFHGSQSYKSYDLFVFLHFVFGLILALSRQLSLAYVVGFLLFSVFEIIRTNNRTFAAEKAIFYLMGLEVFVRMSNIGFPYETGKYGVCLILMLATIQSRDKVKGSMSIIVYFLLLLPSVLLVEVDSFFELRKALSFNLSGPLSLTLSFFYFHRRAYTKEQILSFFAYLLGPIVLLLGVLTVKTPELSTISFSSDANFEVSGGFGPNQVSTVLGLGIIVFIFFFFAKEKLIDKLWLKYCILGLLLFRALLTFSRGGVLAPVLVFTILFIYFLFVFKQSNKMILGFVAVFFFFMTWIAVNRLTDGKLQERYIWEESRLESDYYLSGREEIILFDIKAFLSNPILGVGPGMSKTKRMDMGMSQAVAAHTEFSRVLAEHGVFGVIALLIMCYWTARALFKRMPRFQACFVYPCVIFSMFTMGHSAMRLACVGVLFGFAHIRFLSKTKGSEHEWRPKP